MSGFHRHSLLAFSRAYNSQFMKIARPLAGVVLSVSVAACAAATAPDRAAVAEGIRERSGLTAGIGDGRGAAGTAAGVTIDDGLTEEEAVALALWNNAAFQLDLADLGIARADLVEAGMLRNPVFSFLFPLGPKQLEATLRWPVEALWQRPRRVAAARANVEMVAARLVQNGLNLISEVKIAFEDALAAEARVPVAADAGRLQHRIAELSASRLAAGDISEMEARAATTDAARTEQDLRRAEYDAIVAKERVRFLTGIGAAPADLKLIAPLGGPQPHACGDIAKLRQDAAAARPDVRAAELAVEAAAGRARWERSRLATLSAVLDANGAGKEGFEMGPGLDVELPVFGHNQGQVSRADAEVERASRNYLATRQRVDLEIREAAARYDQAARDAELWQNSILRALERDVEVAQKSYTAGEQPYLFVVETSRRAADARLRAIEASSEVRRARARLERAIGRSCGKDGAGAP